MYGSRKYEINISDRPNVQSHMLVSYNDVVRSITKHVGDPVVYVENFLNALLGEPWWSGSTPFFSDNNPGGRVINFKMYSSISELIDAVVNF
jgi:hypothetical protein